ncbi:MAG TPA: sensor histidine kinase [Actinomycetota bacterium]|nr:sensor histidine kinase [Actinomycetota bacterium]
MDAALGIGRRPRRVSPVAVDWLLAFAALVVGAIGIIPWSSTTRPSALELGAACAALGAQAVPLLWRRTHPFAVLALTTIGFLSFQPLSLGAPVGLLTALFATGTHENRQASLRAFGIWLPVTVGVLALRTVLTGRISGSDVFTFVIAGIAVRAIGTAVGERRAYLRAVEERARLLESTREERARAAVQQERARIARELHDIVAHHVSMMVVQAGAARRSLDARPEDVKASLASIEEAGREAIGEMRKLLGVLRSNGGEASRAPAAGLSQLHELVEHARAAGLHLDVRVVGDATPLAPLVDASAYRIVQEAVTNVIKHAGVDRAQVTITHTADDVAIEVVDEGAGRVDAVRGSGLGLVGMTERAALFGGEMHAGPRVGGGFTVRARLPVRAQERS